MGSVDKNDLLASVLFHCIEWCSLDSHGRVQVRATAASQNNRSPKTPSTMQNHPTFVVRNYDYILKRTCI